MSKPGYNPERVTRNNVRREIWNFRDDEGRRENMWGEKFKGYTSEGYRVFGDTAYDEFDDPVYTISIQDMSTHPHDLDY
jgi:hypothetical protein